MDLTDQQLLIDSVGYALDKFKKSGSTYNFRCPYCGDSQRFKNKTRGNLFIYKQNYIYHCYNCSITKSLNYFLMDHFPNTKINYNLNSYKRNTKKKIAPKCYHKESITSKSIELPCIECLTDNHLAKNYLKRRRIKSLSSFYYTEDFISYANRKVGYQKINSSCKDARIVIPFIDKEKNIFGFQGRTIEDSSMHKYVTIMIDEKMPHIYGLDKINKNERVYIVEGPFDSTFIPNSIAMCGSDINFEYIKDFKDVVFILDNEPHNIHTKKRIKKIIELGYKIVIWPKTIMEKDINDMVLKNIDVLSTIFKHTYSGIKAKMKLCC